jgi:hypothetical protein
MSLTGDCWDNLVAADFCATLKRELVDRLRWRARAEARAGNSRHRRHSSSGFLSPIDYELRQISLPQSSTAAETECVKRHQEMTPSRH